MKARIVTTNEDFAALQPAWNRLAERCSAEPFALWEWAESARTTLHSDSTELFVVLLEEGKEIVALAPLCIRRVGLGPLRGRALRFIGDEHADYGSFLLDPSRNQHDLIKRLFATLFENRQKWDALHLQNLSSRTSQPHLLSEIAASEHGVRARHGERIVTPYLRYADGTPALISKEGRNLRRRERNLERDHRVDIEIGVSLDEESWDAFIDFHLARWPASIFRSEPNQRFFRALFDHLGPAGNLEISRLKVDGAIAAVHIGFRTAHKVAYYIPVYDPSRARDGVGGILLKHMIEHYDGLVEEFDFLRGNESYKFAWNSSIAANENLLAGNGKFFSRLLCNALVFKDHLRRIDWLKKLSDRARSVFAPPARSASRTKPEPVRVEEESAATA